MKLTLTFRILLSLVFTAAMAGSSAAANSEPNGSISGTETNIENTTAFPATSNWDGSLSYEYFVHFLPRFKDTFISRSEGRHYLDLKPKLSGRALNFTAGFNLDPTLVPNLSRRWRVEAKVGDGNMARTTLTKTDPRGSTATISLDGIYLEPGKFVPSIYTTSHKIDEVFGEVFLLGDVWRSRIKEATKGTWYTVSFGPLVSYRKQDVDIDYIAGLDYWRGPAFAHLTAVHYIREDLTVFSGGASLHSKLTTSLGHGRIATMKLRTSGYLQDIRFKGYDCLSGRFRRDQTCDALHHRANTTGGTHFSHVRQHTQMPVPMSAYQGISANGLGLSCPVSLSKWAALSKPHLMKPQSITRAMTILIRLASSMARPSAMVGMDARAYGSNSLQIK